MKAMAMGATNAARFARDTTTAPATGTDDGDLTHTQLVERYREIVAARAEKQTYQQIANTHGISPERVRQILSNGCGGKTLSALPGAGGLSAGTRGVFLRMGYRDVPAILADLRIGKLRVGCAFGIGAQRFAEIEAWARDLDSAANAAEAGARSS